MAQGRGFCGCLRVVHPVRPVRPERHRPRSQRDLRAFRRGRLAQARPPPLLGKGHQAAPKGVALDVAHHGREMSVILHGERLVASLVDAAITDAVAVLDPSPHMGDRQFLHESAQLAVLARPQQQVPMVGHHAEGAQTHPGRLNRIPKDLLECGVVLRLGEQLPPSRGPVEHMVEYAARGISGLSGHARIRLPPESNSVNIGPVPFSGRYGNGGWHEWHFPNR